MEFIYHKTNLYTSDKKYLALAFDDTECDFRSVTPSTTIVIPKPYIYLNGHKNLIYILCAKDVHCSVSIEEKCRWIKFNIPKLLSYQFNMVDVYKENVEKELKQTKNN